MAQTVTPLPSIGDVVPGRDVAGRELRISGHPESDRVVLSIWQDGRCQATVRLARADVPEVTRALVAGLVPLPPTAPPEPTGDDTTPNRPGTVHQLRPGQNPGPAAPTPDLGASLRAAGHQLTTAVSSALRKLTSSR